MNSTKRELPSKESSIFKNILKCYEHRQYKKGLKDTEKILKKFPEHGETLAMKGLFIKNLHTDRSDEGFELVKKGVRLDLTSHICWHVYGLMHRADKNYEEAAKCYQHALKYNRNDLQILRDYALLQIQMRNYENLNDIRHQLLELSPKQRPFWVGLAISEHLLGHHQMAEEVLTKYEGTLSVEPGPMDYEHSELLLYHNSIIEDSGDLEKALKHLDSIQKKVCDKRAWREKRAEYLLKLKRFEDAEPAYRDLIRENPDNYSYIEGLQTAHSIPTDPSILSDEQRTIILGLLSELSKQYPRSNALKRIPLNYATGEVFRSLIDIYLQSALQKGVPSLFVSVKALYNDSIKAKIISELVISYYTNLKASGHFTTSSPEDSQVEPPTALLWTSYFLAQHYDHLREHVRALELIEEAINHTPTLVELYMTKGRILKHAGDLAAAAEVMNEARETDLQDRFINSKCTKYYLRVERVADAEKTIGLFTRNDAPDPVQDLTDMQCMWFALEEAASFSRTGNLGKSLKRYHQIEKHFADITDDQFDFHTYCLRKSTIRAYISLLKLEDQLRSHPYYFECANGAVKAYIQIYDTPKVVTNGENGELDSMSEADKKKAKSKAKKAQLKAAQADVKKVESKDEKAKKAPANEKKYVDDDPEGEKYLKAEDPLAEAFKFLKPLQDLAPNRLETHLLGFEIYIRQKKYLLALRSLLRSSAIDTTNSTLHLQLVKFYQTINAQDITLNPTIKKVIDLEIIKLIPEGVSLSEMNEKYGGSMQEKGDFKGLIVAAEVTYLIDPSKKANAEALMFDNIGKPEFAAARTLQNTTLAYTTLKNKLQSERTEELKALAREWLPLATEFKEEKIEKSQ